MRARHPLSLVLVAAALAMPVRLAAQAGATGAAKPTEKPLTWGPAPDAFPPGARMAVESGDPTKAAPFAVRFEFPAGYRIAPHWHPTDENVYVREGMLMVGMGDSIDMAAAKHLMPGQSGTIQAAMHHWAIAQGRTVLTVNAIGPFAMTYVNPMDDPRHKHKP